MKHFLWTIALLLAGSPCAYAQYIPVTQAVGIGVNNGGGDNLGTSLVGPGVNLMAFGGTDCFCYDNQNSNYPGTSIDPSTDIFYDYVQGSLTVGGQTYCEFGDCSFFEQGLSAGTITFPRNGQNFTVTVPAGLGPITVAVTPLNQPSFYVFLSPGGGDMTLSFNYVPQFPGGPPAYYVLNQATFPATVSAPEPGPLGLMAAGLVGILGLGLKRRLPAAASQRSGYPARRFA